MKKRWERRADLWDVSGSGGHRGAAGALRGHGLRAGNGHAVFVVAPIVCHLRLIKEKNAWLNTCRLFFRIMWPWASAREGTVLPLPPEPRPWSSQICLPSRTWVQTGCLQPIWAEQVPELLPLKTHRWRSWWGRQGPLWWRCHWVRRWRRLWWWLSGSAPEGAVDGSIAPWAAVWPHTSLPHSNQLDSHHAPLPKPSPISTDRPFNFSPSLFRFWFFWKQQKHLVKSLPTTNGKYQTMTEKWRQSRRFVGRGEGASFTAARHHLVENLTHQWSTSHHT